LRACAVGRIIRIDVTTLRKAPDLTAAAKID